MAKEIVIRFDSAPMSEFSPDFVQGMADRMAMSYYKYGALAAAYPNKVDAIESLKLRIQKYEETGNTEFLMDAGNFAMIEFMRPRHPEAFFKATDSTEAPGRKWFGDVDPSRTRRNEEF